MSRSNEFHLFITRFIIGWFIPTLVEIRELTNLGERYIHEFNRLVSVRRLLCLLPLTCTWTLNDSWHSGEGNYSLYSLTYHVYINVYSEAVLSFILEMDLITILEKTVSPGKRTLVRGESALPSICNFTPTGDLII